jgi:deoxyribose-phosphate aldolase
MSNRKALARKALSLLDLTDLNDNSTAKAVADLCRKAVTPHGPTAAICIWPRFVKGARPLLAGSGVRIATVVNFPQGGTDTPSVIAETKKAIFDGAEEIDLVMPYRTFMTGGASIVRSQIAAVRAACGKKARLKVIVETGELAKPGLIHAASEIAIEEGADFIKTSTGKVAVNATPAAARIMLETIRDMKKRTVGFKPAGGIRTLDDAALYIGLADEIMGAGWANPETFRLGASGLLDAILAELDGASAPQTKAAY